MHKTQVFLSPEEDHYRTRLTHTLEVTQIARTIARALRLNEDLCEAIALGHDLGHTPFGHAGERVLNRCYEPGFTHYEQSLRIVEKLEPLNLTWEVREGIVSHKTGISSTLEGQIVKTADRIAYINHDIDDACRAQIMRPEDIPSEICEILGKTHGERINSMTLAVIYGSENVDRITMREPYHSATESLRDFLFDKVYRNPIAKGEEGNAERLIEQLFNYFSNNPDTMPAEYLGICASESVGRAVCDYLSGMTDRYAINLFKRLFIPEVWHNRSQRFVTYENTAAKTNGNT